MLRPLLTFSLLFLAAQASAQSKGLTWPQFRGPTANGVSTDKNVPTKWSDDEGIAWKVKVGAGTSSPIVAGGRIYLTRFSGYNVPGEGKGSQSNLKRELVCLDLKDGKEIWATAVKSKLPEQEDIREQHGYASSTPCTDGERIYAFFGKSGAFAFDMNGKELWQVDVGDELNGWGSANSPVLVGNLVLINASIESETLFALDKKSGKEVWKAEDVKESWNAPILVSLPGGKSELVVATQPKIKAFDPATGKPLWNCDTDITWYMVPQLVSDGGVVYCLGGRSGIGSLAVRAGGSGDVTDSHRLWTSNSGSNVTSPIVHDGHVYWMHEVRGVAFCAEAKTGKVVYEERMERADQVYASPVMANGNIYYTTRSGRTFVVAAKPKFELVATNDLEGRRGMFNASPAIADGKLLIRSDRFLYCIGK